MNADPKAPATKTILQTGQDLIKQGGPVLEDDEHAAVSVEITDKSVRVSGTVELKDNLDLTGDVEKQRGKGGLKGSVGLRIKK